MYFGADGPLVTMRTGMVSNTASLVVLLFVPCKKQNPRPWGQLQQSSDG